MNKYNNPRLTNTTIAGSGMKHPVRPHVILGNPENGYIQGDIMDANAVKEITKEIVDNAPEALDTLKELADAIQENGVADLITKGLLETALADKVDKSDMVESGDANGHDYVEIGGIKWATMNIGANSITDAGLYFAWGDTQGYTADQVGDGEGQKYFGWNDYKYSNNGGSNAADMTKYNSIDGKTILDVEDDAVVANWGGSWRMPTTEEFQALGNATNTTWTKVNNVYGLLCTDKTDSSKTLFFPAAGNASNGSIVGVGSGLNDSGNYWSSSLSPDDFKQNAGSCRSSNYGTVWGIIKSRRLGCSVRGVLGKVDKYATKADVEQLQSSSRFTITENYGQWLLEDTSLHTGDYLYSDRTWGNDSTNAIGICVDTNGQYATFCIPQALSATTWSTERVDTPLLNLRPAIEGAYDLNGFNNTYVITHMSGSYGKYPAFYLAEEQFDYNGYLPAGGEIKQILNLNSENHILYDIITEAGGAVWTSSEVDASSGTVASADGTLSSDFKDEQYPVLSFIRVTKRVDLTQILNIDDLNSRVFALEQAAQS